MGTVANKKWHSHKKVRSERCGGRLVTANRPEVQNATAISATYQK